MIADWSFTPVCGTDFWRIDRDLARGPDLPVLHDHGPQDRRRPGASDASRSGCWWRRQHAAHGAADQRVVDQGRPALGPGPGVRGTAAPGPDRARATFRGRRRPPLRDPARDRGAAPGPGACAGPARIGARCRRRPGPRRRHRGGRDAGPRASPVAGVAEILRRVPHTWTPPPSRRSRSPRRSASSTSRWSDPAHSSWS